jgi:hypothetical protein
MAAVLILRVESWLEARYVQSRIPGQFKLRSTDPAK